jgi:hypothetical protein
MSYEVLMIMAIAGAWLHGYHVGRWWLLVGVTPNKDAVK